MKQRSVQVEKRYDSLWNVSKICVSNMFQNNDISNPLIAMTVDHFTNICHIKVSFKGQDCAEEKLSKN